VRGWQAGLLSFFECECIARSASVGIERARSTTNDPVSMADASTYACLLVRSGCTVGHRGRQQVDLLDVWILGAAHRYIPIEVYANHLYRIVLCLTKLTVSRQTWESSRWLEETLDREENQAGG
jgi:hypothetical protein